MSLITSSKSSSEQWAVSRQGGRLAEEPGGPALTASKPEIIWEICENYFGVGNNPEIFRLVMNIYKARAVSGY